MSGNETGEKMIEIKQTIKERIINVDDSELVLILTLRETFRKVQRFNRSFNFNVINGMLYKFPNKLFRINSALHSLTNDEHSHLWEFILIQTENLIDRASEEQWDYINEYLANTGNYPNLIKI